MLRWWYKCYIGGLNSTLVVYMRHRWSTFYIAVASLPKQQYNNAHLNHQVPNILFYLFYKLTSHTHPRWTTQIREVITHGHTSHSRCLIYFYTHWPIPFVKHFASAWFYQLFSFSGGLRGKWAHPSFSVCCSHCTSWNTMPTTKLQQKHNSILIVSRQRASILHLASIIHEHPLACDMRSDVAPLNVSLYCTVHLNRWPICLHATSSSQTVKWNSLVQGKNAMSHSITSTVTLNTFDQS